MQERKLTIYFTSDLHSYIYPTDYRSQTEKKISAFSNAPAGSKRTATRSSSTAETLLQGSPFGAYCHDTIGSAEKFAEIMNRCGYDYVTLGTTISTTAWHIWTAILMRCMPDASARMSAWGRWLHSLPRAGTYARKRAPRRHCRYCDRLREHLGAPSTCPALRSKTRFRRRPVRSRRWKGNVDLTVCALSRRL